jgi:hypothetical protein
MEKASGAEGPRAGAAAAPLHHLESLAALVERFGPEAEHFCPGTPWVALEMKTDLAGGVGVGREGVDRTWYRPAGPPFHSTDG